MYHNYTRKYLKYKTKYLELKKIYNQYGNNLTLLDLQGKTGTDLQGGKFKKIKICQNRQGNPQLPVVHDLWGSGGELTPWKQAETGCMHEGGGRIRQDNKKPNRSNMPHAPNPTNPDSWRQGTSNAGRRDPLRPWGWIAPSRWWERKCPTGVSALVANITVAITICGRTRATEIILPFAALQPGWQHQQERKRAMAGALLAWLFFVAVTNVFRSAHLKSLVSNLIHARPHIILHSRSA